tara:strand:- start:421 stop:846 length:426 start_codon:yes stop_codon:yes gene_type:complete
MKKEDYSQRDPFMPLFDDELKGDHPYFEFYEYARQKGFCFKYELKRNLIKADLKGVPVSDMVRVIKLFKWKKLSNKTRKKTWRGATPYRYLTAIMHDVKSSRYYREGYNESGVKNPNNEIILSFYYATNVLLKNAYKKDVH